MAFRSQDVSSGLWLRRTISLLTVLRREGVRAAPSSTARREGPGGSQGQQAVTGTHMVAQQGEHGGEA